MATQTIKFYYTNNQTLTCKLFPKGSDSQVGSDLSATEATNAKGIYSVSVTDAPAGEYTLHIYLGSTVVSIVDFTLELATANYYSNTARINEYDNVLTYISGEVGGLAGISVAIPAALLSGSTSSGELEITRGDTYRGQITGLGPLNNVDGLWLTAKRSHKYPDSDSIIQITKQSGLTYINGDVGESGLAYLSIVNESSGNVNVYISQEATYQLPIVKNCIYDIQISRSGDTVSPVQGTFSVFADITRSL